MVRHFSLLLRIVCIVAGVLSHPNLARATKSGPLVVRAENFTVPPSTGPLAHILVRNTADTPRNVTIRPQFPPGWRWTPKQRTVTVAPGRVQRVSFTINGATDVAANRYPVAIVLENGNETAAIHKQTIVCASAPYLTPRIDGNFKDWADAIPATSTTGGKNTVVSTYWDKQNFYVYVQVEEEELNSYKKGAAMVDAVQLAIAPQRAVTPSAATDRAERYEFLLVDVSGMFAKDKCLVLVRAGDTLSVAQKARAIADLPELDGARVVVKRRGETTHYECAIPFAAMPNIRPDVGREICFSLLVHDPDGTGRRDWGQASGLWPDQRSPLAWCAWGETTWGGDPPYDGKIEWGLCSSKH